VKHGVEDGCWIIRVLLPVGFLVAGGFGGFRASCEFSNFVLMSMSLVGSFDCTVKLVKLLLKDRLVGVWKLNLIGLRVLLFCGVYINPVVQVTIF